MQDTYRKNIFEAIQQAAGQRAKELYDSSHDADGNVTNPYWSDSYYNDLLRYSEGLAEFEDGVHSLSELDFADLASIAKDFEGLSELVATNEQLFNEAQAQIDQANKAMEEGEKEMAATKETIEDLKAAAAQSAAEMNAVLNDGSGKIDAGAAAAAAAIEAGGETLGSKLAGLRVPVGYIPGVAMPRATGMDYVPYTGFRAELHRGEAILTKAEADKYRGGSGTAEVVGAIQGMRGDLQNLRLTVGRKSFGHAVVDYGGDRAARYIDNKSSREYAGYGS